MLHINIIPVDVLDAAYSLYSEQKICEKSFLFLLVHPRFFWSFLVKVVIIESILLMSSW
jgi:hypothetical protein